MYFLQFELCSSSRLCCSPNFSPLEASSITAWVDSKKKKPYRISKIFLQSFVLLPPPFGYKKCKLKRGKGVVCCTKEKIIRKKVELDFFSAQCHGLLIFLKFTRKVLSFLPNKVIFTLSVDSFTWTMFGST